MPSSEQKIGDLSERGRVETRADLLAGSAGYQHFLKRLSGFISPHEATDAHHRFAVARRMFWGTLIAFVLAYIVINQLLGPHGLKLASWGNDFLRAALFMAVVLLVKWRRVSVAGQMLLPLAALCYLPMPIIEESNWWYMPVVFGVMVASLWVIGWCIDAGAEQGRETWQQAICLALPLLAVILFIVLNIIASVWVMDNAALPVLSSLSALACVPIMLLVGNEDPKGTDVEFLFFAAWKRWRFLISGRALAILLGLVPFLLFANLLDYEEELELAKEVDKAPYILRMDHPIDHWVAYYWMQEGRFLRTTDFETPPEEENLPVVQRFYLITPVPEAQHAARTDEHGAAAPAPGAHAASMPDVDDVFDMKVEMLDLNRREMTLHEFEEEIEKFEVLRITSKEKLLERTKDATDVMGGNLVSITYHKTGHGGVVFAEGTTFRPQNPEDLERIISLYARPKWVFFAFGVFGFVFMWRRGGDSSLARWIGIWLVGISLIPILAASDDTLPHITHWLWQHSIMYHWNSLSSAAQPIFALLFLTASTAAILWMLQISPAVCWAYICWPTRIYPNLPPIVRQLMIIGKLAAVVMLTVIIFFLTVVPMELLVKGSQLWEFLLFQIASSAVFILSGMVVRIFTSRVSEVPRLGFWPVLAIIAMNLTFLFFSPSLLFFEEHAPSPVLVNMGVAFGCLFIGIMSFLILKRDFLRVRAIPGLTMLILILFVPLAVHKSEKMVTPFLTSGPFFRERGAEMVALMLIMLFFPRMHHWLHEVLLKISVPKLRHIEHRVEHALEEIVDADDDQSRIHMISELFEQLHVKEYVFLSRRPHGTFVVEINTLGKETGPSLEMSEAVRKFLGHRRHFIDLQTMAFEWLFFFHQFELHRIAEATGCRYLLPISVGESVRGLLLLPDGPGGAVVANPAMSENINNLGIAAALNRPRKA